MKSTNIGAEGVEESLTVKAIAVDRLRIDKHDPWGS
jgi:hypothetical protein